MPSSIKRLGMVPKAFFMSKETATNSDSHNACGNDGWVEEWPRSFKRIFPDADVFLQDNTLPRQPAGRDVTLLLADNGSYTVVDDTFARLHTPVDLFVARGTARGSCAWTHQNNASISVCIPAGANGCNRNCTLGQGHSHFFFRDSEFHKAPTEERIQDFLSHVVLNRSSVRNDIKRLLDSARVKYQEPKMHYGLDYIGVLCNSSNVAAIFWSLGDFNPRSVYEALFCNLPVFVSEEAHSAEGLNSTVGRILSVASDNATVVRNFREFLDTDWGDLPFQYAVKHMSIQNELRRLISKLAGSE
eukprot:gene35741-43353_t